MATFHRLFGDTGQSPTQDELRRALGAGLDYGNQLDGIASSTLRDTLKREGLEWPKRRSWPRQ